MSVFCWRPPGQLWFCTSDRRPDWGEPGRWKTPFMIKFRVALIFTFTLTVAVHGENWPNWRGPSSTGISTETGLPVRWSDTENVAWKASIRGLGISSPIVWGDRVIVTSQAGNNLSRPGPRLFQQGDAAAAGERALAGPSRGASGTAFLVTAFNCADGRKLW